MTTKIPIRPVGDKLLVQRCDVAPVSVGGIIIPDSAKEKPSEGTVVALGSKKFTVEVGDNVLFTKFAGTEVSYEGQTFLVMLEEDILAVVH